MKAQRTHHLLHREEARPVVLISEGSASGLDRCDVVVVTANRIDSGGPDGSLAPAAGSHPPP